MTGGAPLNDTATTWVDDEQPGLHAVDIEIEEVFSETDDEDPVGEGIADLYR